MQRLLCATDFSERSDRALRRAVLVARAEKAELDLVHVVDDDRPKRLVDHEATDAWALLRQQMATLGSVDGVKGRSDVILADPFEGIVRATEERRPDILVLGPHRRQFLWDAFVGTTAERAIRKVACPVLSVNGPPVSPYRQILLTTDLSEASNAALQRYFDLGICAAANHAILTVFDVLALRLAMSDSLPREDRDHHVATEAAEARKSLATFAGTLARADLQLLVRHRETTEANEILKAVEQTQADLVVMATQGKGGFARMMLGSVTEKVLQNANVDVLTLPPPRVE